MVHLSSNGLSSEGECAQTEAFLSQFPQSWIVLLRLLRRVDDLAEKSLVQQLRLLQLDGELVQALCEAARGDNRPINKWLFSLSPEYSGPVAWLAPVEFAGTQRYAWMIGYQSSLSSELQKRFQKATQTASQDPLLRQQLVPKPLFFVCPLEVSVFDGREFRKDTNQDEFAIFQTNYRAKKSELSDFEQRMAINFEYLVNYRRKTIDRARTLGVAQAALQDLDADLELFALIHSEGHNRGHFLGPWPLEKEKKITLYQALEELRACSAGIRLGEHLGLSDKQLNALAVSVFLVRFLGYAFDAYCLPNLERRTARELTIGLMLFEILLARGAIEVSASAQLQIDPVKLRQTLIDSLTDIHEVEAAAVRSGKNTELLRDLARRWYKLAFPGRSYSQQAIAVFDRLLQKGVSHAPSL